MSQFSLIFRHAAALGLIGSLICVGGTASAETNQGVASQHPTPAANQGHLPTIVTQEQAAAALTELRTNFASARHIDAAGSETFTLSEGITMRFEKDTTNRIGGGMDGWKPYIEFNHTEQGMLVSGATAALRAAICAIPGVGVVACGVASVLLGVAASYVADHRCPGNLRVTVDNARCV